MPTLIDIAHVLAAVLAWTWSLAPVPMTAAAVTGIIAFAAMLAYPRAGLRPRWERPLARVTRGGAASVHGPPPDLFVRRDAHTRPGGRSPAQRDDRGVS